MRKKKAAFLTLCLYSLLLWVYISGRIILDYVGLNSLFINSIPFFTFERLGALAFVLSMLFMYLCLTTN